MYLEPGRTYYVGTQQHRSGGLFLLLVQPKGESAPIRALVRCVALRQCGHFMMGVARIGGTTLTVSGSYGGDGLPMSVERHVYDRAVPLPDHLYKAWNTGGGWNSAGSEAPAMRKWALANLDALRA